MDPLTLIGITGAVILLIFFLLSQFKRIHVDHLAYDIANFVGALLLFVYAASIESIPFLLTNGVWGAFSLRDVIVRLVKKK